MSDETGSTFGRLVERYDPDRGATWGQLVDHYDPERGSTFGQVVGRLGGGGAGNGLILGDAFPVGAETSNDPREDWREGGDYVPGMIGIVPVETGVWGGVVVSINDVGYFNIRLNFGTPTYRPVFRGA